MNKLPVFGILVLMLLVISGYVSSSPNAEPQATPIEVVRQLSDRHVEYYEQHLITLGIERRQP